MKYKAVFFDFDGTLNESGPAIFAATRAALARLSVSCTLSDEEMRPLVGPPLYDGFTKILGLNDETANAAIDAYRSLAKTVGAELNHPFPGILDMLCELRSSGFLIAVVTAKVQGTAEEHIARYGYAPYIDLICGAYSNGKCEKAELLALAMSKLSVTADEAVMVGDRCFDIEAANANGVDSIGVLYGYGTRDELIDAGAARIVESVDQLRNLFTQRQEELA